MWIGLVETRTSDNDYMPAKNIYIFIYLQKKTYDYVHGQMNCFSHHLHLIFLCFNSLKIKKNLMFFCCEFLSDMINSKQFYNASLIYPHIVAYKRASGACDYVFSI